MIAAPSTEARHNKESENGPAEPAIGGWATLAIYGVFVAATLLPLLWVQVPPLVDYPNHLARMWIIVHGANIPALAHNYVVHWRILPDLGMDLVVPALAHLMPVVEAGRLFVAMAMLGPVAGTIILYRVLHGRFSIWPVWSVLLVYNAMLFWGFVNCLFASGLYMLAFSGWIASRNWRPAPRIALFSVVAAVLFLMHLFAFGLYGLTVASYEIGRRIEGRRLPAGSLPSYILVCLQFVPGLMLWYLSFGNVRSAHTAYGDLASRVKALFAGVDFNHAVAPLDAAIWAAIAIFVVFAFSRRALRVVPEMKLPIAALIVAAIVMPSFVNGSALVEIRLPVILPFVFLGASDLQLTHTSWQRILATIAVGLFALRIWTVSVCWQDYGRWFDEFRRASTVIPPGARLLVVESRIPVKKRRLPGVPRALAFIQSAVFSHMGALTVIDRSAFFPYLFTQATPLAVTPRNAAVAQSASDPISPLAMILTSNPRTARAVEMEPDFYGQLPYWRDWPHTLDYMLWIDFGTAKTFHMKPLKLVAAGSFFRIFRIERGSAIR